MANYFVVENEKGLFFYKDEEHTLLHREDGPATIWKSGTKGWYVDGKCHRENGPAVIWPSGSAEWYVDGKLHREDGPAVVYADGEQHWFINGKRHRENGPAIIFPSSREEYWVNGEELTQEEFNTRNCTPAEVVINGVKYRKV